PCSARRTSSRNPPVFSSRCRRRCWRCTAGSSRPSIRGAFFIPAGCTRRSDIQPQLAEFIRNTPEGKQADAVLRKCLHCGFCLATCPTYQLLGDELDSPRGRIYLIKQVLEGKTATDKTRLHLDRCLTCRACETTCPSGVEYHK